MPSGDKAGDKQNLITAAKRVEAATPSYDSVRSDDSHCHEDGPEASGGSVDENARRKLLIASALCLVFMTIEIVGGALAHSLAIMTDAAHLLTDFASFMISLLALYIAARPATKQMSFGWHRAEVVGALISVLLIWVVTGILFYLAVERVVHKNFSVNGRVMLITSSLGVIVNMIMAVALHQHGHTHGLPSHQHQEQQQQQDQLTSSSVGSSSGRSSPNNGQNSAAARDESHGHSHNLNVRAAFIHVVGDLIQSVGVMIAAVIIFIEPKYKLADPICTFIFSILVLLTTVAVLKDAMYVLMEGVPQGIDFNQVAATLSEVQGVKDVHNLRMWSLTTSRNALSVHLAIDQSSSRQSQRILKEARRIIRRQFRIHEVTIQLEEYDPEMAMCHLCQHPEE